MTNAQDLESRFARSRAYRVQAHHLIPGGAHTYAKGEDQYPLHAPAAIVRGQGAHVWDLDGNEFIEYGAGLRSVTLGHAYPRVVRAAHEWMLRGSNFVCPAEIEVEYAEELLASIEAGEMVKFAKNGSDVTTAAVKLARAATGRDLVAVCVDHPFFSTDDWFICTTEMNAGIPGSVRDLTLTFPYGELDAVRQLFDAYEGRIACLVLEPVKYTEPRERYLPELRRLCDSRGALLILDEMITGFRWAIGGAQQVYGVRPHLSTFGKGMANGFSVSALVGERAIMERGGLRPHDERVFLLSTTHGAETHGLAAGLETLRIYREEPVIETLERQGARLRDGVIPLIREHGVDGHFTLAGRGCNLVFGTAGRDRRPSQEFRALFMQELIRRGVLAPSFVVNYSHGDAEIDQTIEAVDGALEVYARALEDGVEKHLEGEGTKVVFRRFG